MRTLEQTIERVLTRLEDVNSAVWTRDEVTGYIKKGYDQFARDTLCLWDMTFVAEDQPYCANHVAKWEEAHFPAGWIIGGIFNYTGGTTGGTSTAPPSIPWEQQYIDNGVGPCDHTNFWESTLNHTYQDNFLATAQLPPETISVARVTYDNYRIDPQYSSDLAEHYKFYEYIQGPQRSYALDKDGYFTIRKVPVPAGKGNFYLHESSSGGAEVVGSTAVFGTIRYQTANEFETSPTYNAPSVNGASRGVLRRVVGQFPSGYSPYGVPRRLYSDVKNFRVEYYRRGKDLSTTPFEIPDRYVKYVELYAMSLARERDGVGQSKQVAAHYLARYQEGVARMRKRAEKVLKEYTHKMGGGVPLNLAPSRATLPYHYPALPTSAFSR